MKARRAAPEAERGKAMAQLPGIETGRPLATVDVHAAQRPTIGRHVTSVARHALLIAVAVIFTFPVYWMLISGLKTSAEIFAQPVVWWPHALQWQNITDTLNYPGFPFLRYLWNSIFIAGTVTLGTLFSCATAAYGFARMRFPGR